MGDLVSDIAHVLDHGVKVAMMYGERDYTCDWVQGELTSLKLPWGSKDDFSAAGFAPLVISSHPSGTLTRQYGNLSFTQVHEAGQRVPSRQLEIGYVIFMRVLLGRVIATRTVDLQQAAAKGERYATEGPSDMWWKKSDVVPAFPHECYHPGIGGCTANERSGRSMTVPLSSIVIGRNEIWCRSLVLKPDRQIPFRGGW